MKYRKPILVAALMVMALFYAGDWLLRNQFEGPLESSHKRTARLQEEIAARQRDLEKARKAAKTLDRFKAQSLPSNPEVARSLYQGWLLELVGQVGLTNPKVDSSEPLNRKGMYHQLSFSLRGRGTLEQLARFLFAFYRVDHLHQIRSLSATPLQGTEELDLSVGIEALALAQADRKDRLSTRTSDRLASNKFEDYQVIAQRNLFGASVTSDATQYTFLTSVNYVDGQPQAWFTIRTSDEILKLREGETLEIGPFKASVSGITDSDVIIESEGERWLVTIGESLTEAAALPPEF
jgi:hypothetical protein